MLEEIVGKPICKNCETVIPVWDGDSLINTWQRDGFNHYECKCPTCGSLQSFNIEIEGDSSEKPLGFLFIDYFRSFFKGVFTW